MVDGNRPARIVRTLAERGLGVRRWAPWAGHAWTVAVLGALSPLMVEPGLRVLGL